MIMEIMKMSVEGATKTSCFFSESFGPSYPEVTIKDHSLIIIIIKLHISLDYRNLK